MNADRDRLDCSLTNHGLNFILDRVNPDGMPCRNATMPAILFDSHLLRTHYIKAKRTQGNDVLQPLNKNGPNNPLHQHRRYNPGSFSPRQSVGSHCANIRQGAPRRLSIGSRLVWVIARPLRGKVYTVAAGNFPLLHWAVVISDPGYGKKQMFELCRRLSTPNPGIPHSTRIGIVHQLFRSPDGRNSHRDVGVFNVSTLKREFPECSIAYAGSTRHSDEQILRFGIFPFLNVADAELWG